MSADEHFEVHPAANDHATMGHPPFWASLIWGVASWCMVRLSWSSSGN